MNSSILTDIKKFLGIPEEYEHFDIDIITHINSALFTLTQIGVKTNVNFVLSDKTQTWSEYINQSAEVGVSPLKSALISITKKDSNIGMIKSYVYMKVKLAFDPPQNSFGIESINKMINEYESRLQIEYDK